MTNLSISECLNETGLLLKYLFTPFRQLMSSRVAIGHQYLACLIDSLLKRGYLNGSREDGYQITSKSNGAIKEQIKVNEGNSNNMGFFNLRRNHKSRVNRAIQLFPHGEGDMCGIIGCVAQGTVN